MEKDGDVCDLKGSFVNGTNDGEAYPKRWVAALVQMNCEKKVAAKLDKMGIANYVPIQKEEHQWSDRKKRIDRIVIPMVVFVRIAKEEEDEFRRLPFILKFITYPGAEELATPIPDEQIEQLQFLLKHSESPVTFCNNIEIGDAVRVVKGPLKGFIGHCCGASNSEVAIHLDMLGYATTHLAKDCIERIEKYN